MRLSRILLAVSISTGLVFAGTTTTSTSTATTTEKVTPAAEKAPVKPAPIIIKGKVEAVDAIANILVVKTLKKVDSIAVNSETKITDLGKDVILSDIKTGETVKVTCKKDDGKLVATDVKVGVAQAKKVTTTTTTTTTTTPPAAPVEKK